MSYKEKVDIYKLGNEINKINDGTSEAMAQILGVDLSVRKYNFIDALFYLNKKEKEIEELKRDNQFCCGKAMGYYGSGQYQCHVCGKEMSS